MDYSLTTIDSAVQNYSCGQNNPIMYGSITIAQTVHLSSYNARSQKPFSRILIQASFLCIFRIFYFTNSEYSTTVMKYQLINLIFFDNFPTQLYTQTYILLPGYNSSQQNTPKCICTWGCLLLHTVPSYKVAGTLLRPLLCGRYNSVTDIILFELFSCLRSNNVFHRTP